MESHRFAIIEDNREFAEVVDAIMDFTVKIFKEVSAFEDEGFDLIFTDLRLKETYGPETIAKLRAKTTAPIIVLTGLGGPFLSATDMQMFLEAGATEVFNKEIITDPAFKGMVASIIEKHHGAKIQLHEADTGRNNGAGGPCGPAGDSASKE